MVGRARTGAIVNQMEKLPIWAVTPDKITAVVERIVEKVQPRKIIIFGSAARGDTNRNSDLDILVVLSGDIPHPRRESIRIRSLLSGILMPIEILVISENRLLELAEQPGLIYREVLRTGKVAYHAAA